MELSMKATMSTERNMEQALSNGLMAQCTLVNSITITFTVRVYTPGVTVVSTKENGGITKCTAKVLLPGLMAESTLVNTSTIRNKDTVNLSGLMEDAIKETGTMVNNMVKVFM
jgi:uncharacterized protein (UPF0333 family)